MIVASIILLKCKILRDCIPSLNMKVQIQKKDIAVNLKNAQLL